jgi:hypothetical protein
MEDSADEMAECIEALESVPDAADHETSDIHQQRHQGMLTLESIMTSPRKCHLGYEMRLYK